MIPARGELPNPRTDAVVVIGDHAAIHADTVARLLQQPEVVQLRRRVRGDDVDLHGALVALSLFALQVNSTSACGRTQAPHPEIDTSSGWLTAAEFAERFDVTPETVRAWCRSGRLSRAERPGYAWLIHPGEVEAHRRRRDAA